MSEAEQREIAKNLFEQTREEIRDALKLEEERRATLVKNLYRLRALRLSRDKTEQEVSITDSTPAH
jgi:phage portal protein BeeE